MSRTKSSSSWAAMRASSHSHNQQQLPTETSPQPLLWKPRGQQHINKPPPEAGAFPALGTDSTSQPHTAATGQPQQSAAGAADAGTPGLGRRRSLSAPSLAAAPQQYSAVAGRSGRAGGHTRSSSVDRSTSQVNTTPSPQQCLERQHPQHQQQQHQQEQHQLEAGLQLLQECHPWCEAVMLHEVLQAFGGDVAAALEALQDMIPAAGANRPGGPGSSSSCSEGSCSDTSSERRPKAAAGAAGSTAVPQTWPAGPEQVDDDSPARGLQQLQLEDTRQQQQQQQHLQGPVVQDTYRALRGDAVKLSHKYRKAAKRCSGAAAARSQGDYSGAAQLAAEAATLKAAADAAHAAAALKIEVTNNAQTPYGLWELDLHGLHVNEALQSLQERMQLLRDIAQDLRKTAAVSAAAGSAPAQASPAAAGGREHVRPAAPLHGAARPAGGSTTQAVLTSLLLPAGGVLPWEQQLAAMRQELRVIVGKGLHSSGGEASLPRVVEQWLLRQGYKYIWREGTISVQLRLL